MTFAKKLLTISTLVISIWLIIGIIIYRKSTFDLFSSLDKLHVEESQTKVGEIEACKTEGRKLSENFWKKIDLQTKSIPDSVTSLVPSEEVLSEFTVIQDTKVHYLYIKPEVKRSLSILLLHGQSFTADTWKKLKTIQYLAAFGYYAVAVDLPGFGLSPSVPNLNRTDFLSSLIQQLHLKNVVIVSPSMSGSYSIDFLLRHHKDMAGFVPVSPVNTYALDRNPCKGNATTPFFDRECLKVMPYLKRIVPALSCIKVPTIVVFGEDDRKKNSAKLCFIPNSQGVEIPNGKHAAYLSNPGLWHKVLYNYLDVLGDTAGCLYK